MCACVLCVDTAGDWLMMSECSGISSAVWLLQRPWRDSGRAGLSPSWAVMNGSYSELAMTAPLRACDKCLHSAMHPVPHSWGFLLLYLFKIQLSFYLNSHLHPPRSLISVNIYTAGCVWSSTVTSGFDGCFALTFIKSIEVRVFPEKIVFRVESMTHISYCLILIDWPQE